MIGGEPQVGCVAGHLDEVTAVPLGCRVEVTVIGDPCPPVVAQGVEQPVADGAVGSLTFDHRRVDQGGDPVDDVVIGPGDGFGCGQVERSEEDREAIEELLLLGGEQLVAPVDGRSEALLARGGRSGGDEEPEAVVEMVCDLGGAQHADATSRQLDRQGEPLQCSADTRDLGGLDRIRYEPFVDLSGSFGEQELGVGESERFAGRGKTQRVHRVAFLAGGVQGEATRREDLEVWGAFEQDGRQVRDVVGHVFAVVEHQQGAAVGEVAHQQRLGFHAWLSCQPEHLDGSADDVGAGCGNGEIDPPHAVGEASEHLAADFPGQAGLADTSDADEGDETMVVDQIYDFGGFPVPADERRDERRQIARWPQVEFRVLQEDAIFECARLGGRFQTDFFDEHIPEIPSDAQRLDLSAGSVQREHQVPVELLPVGVQSDERFEFRDELFVSSEGEFGGDEQLDRLGVQLFEFGGSERDEWGFVGEVAERPAPP